MDSVEEHLHGLNARLIIFADIRIDERRWPWPAMLSSKDEDVTVIDIPQTDDGAVDISFLKKELGQFFDDNGIFDTGDGLADPEAVVEFFGLQNETNN